MSTISTTETRIEGKNIKLTNLNKLMWPEGLTKAHLVKYYTDVAPYLLPYIKERPLVMKRYPDGIEGGFFYQKECPNYAPEWIKTESIRHSDKTVNYIICEDAATLVWLANQGCIEIHAWLCKQSHIEYPDIAIIDLDPGEEAKFRDVLEVALVIKNALDHLKLVGYPKTSGATGIHIFIPLRPVYTFQQVTKAMGLIAQTVADAFSEKATIERSLAKRDKRKIYVDYLQNTRGKSMAWTYSLRPIAGAPISTPVMWEEIEKLHLKPSEFNIYTMGNRLKFFGDLHQDLLRKHQDIGHILRLIS
ncbi:DNA primase, small subunit [Desulforamulus reducens MI-1]|uniref:DNA primase, small subunit n=1 Tax=Desulforamulus reducens (strain ATCC BAA-1160 / DSM 100696 / MI-1) TaxID=349161 RepID=A4J601_DESRM|nr:non-homologous end-joining DNA ligase [Desulforamulus reducens]ABO50504.1 DNA primase, small subunit [Desulforamulus reducens MI-1]